MFIQFKVKNNVDRNPKSTLHWSLLGEWLYHKGAQRCVRRMHPLAHFSLLVPCFHSHEENRTINAKGKGRFRFREAYRPYIINKRWQRIWEDSRLMRSFLNKVLLLTLDGLTKESCIAAYLRCAWVGLVKKSGLLFTWFSLKQCSSSSLQIAYGGQYTPQLLPTPVPVPVRSVVKWKETRNCIPPSLLLSTQSIHIQLTTSPTLYPIFLLATRIRRP